MRTNATVRARDLGADFGAPGPPRAGRRRGRSGHAGQSGQSGQAGAAGPTPVRVLELRGEVDLSNARDVLGRLTAQIPNEAQLVVLDLSGTRHLDSSGVAMLFQLAERLSRSRQDLRLVVPPEAPIRTVIELTAVDRVIPVDDSLGAAGSGRGPEPQR